MADTTSSEDDHGLQVFNIPNIIKNAREYQQNMGNQSIYRIEYNSSEYWVYREFGGSHNIFINEDTGYLYSIGTNTCGIGGLHVVDINNPLNPIKAGCFAHANDSSYVHDAQCVNYHGPDTQYQGLFVYSISIKSMLSFPMLFHAKNIEKTCKIQLISY